ncbi:MAG: CcmD family protein [Flammeovirgaceae bacterium]
MAKTALFLLLSMHVAAQTQEVNMADGMRAEGKIYVVVAIVLVILFGLMGYLFFLDRKITKIEKRLPK